MAERVEMIQLSPTMEEGKLVAWLKKEGDRISTGDLIAEVETDKATMEMESFFDGTLLKILVPAGTAARVGTVLAIIGAPGEDVGALLTGAPAGAAPGPAVAEATAAAAPVVATGSADGRILASPLARKVAADKGVDLAQVEGSGPSGRIIRRDVDGAVAAPALGAVSAPAPAAAPAATRAPVASAPAAHVPVVAPAGSRRVELSPMRKAIARNLGVAWQAPAFMLTREIAMDAASALRAQINADLAASGSTAKISFNDLVIKAAARALIDEPGLNCAYDGDSLVMYDSADIGMAVALDGGLITPVIRGAQHKSVLQIAQEARELAGRARDKKLKPEEYTGSTFSISNLGMFGIDHFTAVLNPPAAAILAVGALKKQPVVKGDGTLGVGERMTVTLTCDHRAVDGALGATWLQKFVTYLEHPMLLLV